MNTENLVNIFRGLSSDSQKEALEAMEHISEYDNMDFVAYQDKVADISIRLDRVDQLCKMLCGYFKYSDRYYKENRDEAAQFFCCDYSKIQALVNVVTDSISDLAKTADALAEVSISK